MYIRTKDEALENLAEILKIPDRRDQIIQSTVRIMLCLEVEPRLLLSDCQALLIEGGLETLRVRRRQVVEAAEDLPAGARDPADDKMFEDVASALDALRFTSVVRQLFPEIRADRWQIGRTILLYESGVREQIAGAVQGHADPARIAAARDAIEGMITVLRPTWVDRVGALRSACLEAVKATGMEADRVHEESEILYELFAISDVRAGDLLTAIDSNPREAAELILKVRDMADAARALQAEPPAGSGSASKEVA